MLQKRLFPLILPILLAACATTERGRAQLVAPDGVGAVYSEIDLRTRLALTAERSCAENVCETATAFRRQVEAVGADLARAAQEAYPELSQRVPRFEFVVPAKEQVGTLSNASGTVVVLDGLSELALDDAALAFVIAREMGHVIGRHHDENSAMSIIASIVAQLVFPVANILRGAAAAIPMTTTTALTATAASMVGSRVLRAVNRPDQLDEADAIALRLLTHSGRNLEEVGRSVDKAALKLAIIGEEGWILEFMQSKARLDQLGCGQPALPLPEAVAVVSGDAFVLE